MSDSPQAPHRGTPRKAAVAAWIGSALEYYDFFIYGSAAALIFSKVFFDASDPATATLQSLATFGVAYAARPVGAFFLGHVGDRFGRKKIMVFTLILMGVSTFLIGCLPTREQVGGLAPVLLVILRVMQGLSAAGEQASANSMTLEHAPENRRGYYTSFTLNGTQFGQILATLVFIPVAALPEEQLLSWGWRVPFWLSVAVAVAGWVIRRKLDETPAFEQEVAQGTVPKLPLADLFRDHWRSVLRVVCAALIATVSTIFTVWALNYATGDAVGLDKATMLWVSTAANAVALLALPLWATLSDRIGRKPVFLIGAVGSPIMIFFYLAAINSENYLLIFLVGILTLGVVYSASNGIWPSLYGEMFSTRVRLSGMAIGTQIGFAIAGFAVATAAGIVTPQGWLGLQGWVGVAIFTAILCAISAVAVATARETHRVPTADLGRPTGKDRLELTPQ
ncbi:MFS transporter [Planobispora longispora]|uniref:MFS transporter n=1 Tax=Planobispora longispora TaxID=28887 RepID=A0A8J3RSL1_9ACTN|nr:MFS transporter [Planobispora longispora]BFE85434.1 MFS transporter [Planobispora longispora]GIH80348.1 MFS transporter [Planobispora longispora]